MASFDRVLVAPFAMELTETLRAAVQAANAGCRVRLLSWPLPGLARFHKQLTTCPEGWRQWNGQGLRSKATRSAVGVAWWSDFVGRPHLRIVGCRMNLPEGYRENFLTAGREQPPLTLVYPDHTLFHVRGESTRQIVACSCGAWGEPAEIGWMGERCGPCHDRAEAGEAKPPRTWVLGRPDQNYSVSAVCFSPDGRTLVSGHQIGVMRLWDVETGREQAVFEEPDRPASLQEVSKRLTGVRFNPDGQTLALGWEDDRQCEVIIRDVRSGERRAGISRLEPATRFLFTPDGSGLVTIGWKPVLWDARTGKRLATFQGGRNCHGGEAVSPDGRTLAVIAWPTDVLQMWEVPSRLFLGESRPIPGTATEGLAFAPSGGALAIGSEYQPWEAILWNPAAREVLRRLPAESWVRGLCFSSDGRTLLGHDRWKTVMAWDLASGVCVSLRWSLLQVNDLAVSPDGRVLAVALNNGTVRLLPAEMFAS
jgi:hypothetical protein